MASPIWNAAKHLEQIFYELKDFLYEDGKPFIRGGAEGTPNPHTEEEYREILKSIMWNAKYEYDNIAIEMGWVDDVESKKKKKDDFEH